MVSDEKIKELAYSIWEEEGRPEGKDVEHYFRARKIMEETYSTHQTELAPSRQSNVEFPPTPSPTANTKRPVLNVYRGHTKRGYGLK
jgi:hypothetical protein